MKNWEKPTFSYEEVLKELLRPRNAWKTARICAIPKGNQVTNEQDLRPISIIPVLSKIYERQIFQQVTTFIEWKVIVESNISAYRKGQSTIHVLQVIHDDIIKTMRRGEVSMMILVDFSKAFDTIKFQNLIKKVSHLGFSKNFLKHASEPTRTTVVDTPHGGGVLCLMWWIRHTEVGYYANVVGYYA